jgi:hypothetical protein
MRTLIVSPCFPPENSPGALRAHGFARHWARQSVAVEVLTSRRTAETDDLRLDAPGVAVHAIASGSTWATASGWLAHRGGDQCSTEQPALWRRLARRVRSRTGILSSARMPDVSDAWVRPAIEFARTHGPWDVILSSSGPYTAHLVARELKSLWPRTLWVADFRDPWTDGDLFGGLFPFTLIERHLEMRCLGAADLITTVSEQLAERFSRRTATPVMTVFNGHDEDLLVQHSLESPSTSNRGVRIVYTGGFYLGGHDPAPLFDAFAELTTARPEGADRLRLVIAGPGGEHWRRHARSTRTEHMLEVLERVSRGRAWQLQQHADALLVLDWRHPGAGVLTSKLFEYLFRSAPILAVGGSPESPIGQLLKSTQRGIHLAASVPRIRSFLEQLLDDPEKLRFPGNQSVIGELTRERQALVLLGRIRCALAERNAVSPSTNG